MVLEGSSICGADSKIAMQWSPHGWISSRHFSVRSRPRADSLLQRNSLGLAKDSLLQSGTIPPDDFYDPGAEYAQVLVEAKEHAMKIGGRDACSSGPGTFTFARGHGIGVEFAGCHPKGSGQGKKSRDGSKKGHSWKETIFFWRRLKTDRAYHSSVTPQQAQMSRRSVSGPLYTDGLPVHPNHRRSSGYLSDSSRINTVPLSPYVPLKQHYRPRNYSGPLYTVS